VPQDPKHNTCKQYECQANFTKSSEEINETNKIKWQAINLPTTIGDIIAKAPGFIISLRDADATIATQRP
jgi:hypothetical protein